MAGGKNAEGYSDPTATTAISKASRRKKKRGNKRSRNNDRHDYENIYGHPRTRVYRAGDRPDRIRHHDGKRGEDR